MKNACFWESATQIQELRSAFFLEAEFVNKLLVICCEGVQFPGDPSPPADQPVQDQQFKIHEQKINREK